MENYYDLLLIFISCLKGPKTERVHIFSNMHKI